MFSLLLKQPLESSNNIVLPLILCEELVCTFDSKTAGLRFVNVVSKQAALYWTMKIGSFNLKGTRRFVAYTFVFFTPSLAYIRQVKSPVWECQTSFQNHHARTGEYRNCSSSLHAMQTYGARFFSRVIYEDHCNTVDQNVLTNCRPFYKTRTVHVLGHDSL